MGQLQCSWPNYYYASYKIAFKKEVRTHSWWFFSIPPQCSPRRASRTALKRKIRWDEEKPDFTAYEKPGHFAGPSAAGPPLTGPGPSGVEGSPESSQKVKTAKGDPGDGNAGGAVVYKNK